VLDFSEATNRALSKDAGEKYGASYFGTGNQNRGMAKLGPRSDGQLQEDLADKMKSELIRMLSVKSLNPPRSRSSWRLKKSCNQT